MLSGTYYVSFFNPVDSLIISTYFAGTSGGAYDPVYGFLQDQSAGFILSGSELPPVPLPAALPLFATGLSMMGLLGWRSKRKAKALAAS